jgi:hypothetical protein
VKDRYNLAFETRRTAISSGALHAPVAQAEEHIAELLKLSVDERARAARLLLDTSTTPTSIRPLSRSGSMR